MNRIFLIGNLTRDPELTETASGIKICRFSIAVNRSYGNTEDKKTDFFNIVAWRGLGENVAKYAKKGNKVCVVGSVELRTYDDKDGVRRTAMDVVASDVEFLTPKGYSSASSDDGYSSGYSSGSSSSSSRDSGRPQLQPFDDDSDIPF
ncbi:MAG: single-stranded DNA-binding protein [Clostridia bacterium]|nr:single-stranded DNA-binding protein [Clostridia bacterium]